MFCNITTHTFCSMCDTMNYTKPLSICNYSWITVGAKVVHVKNSTRKSTSSTLLYFSLSFSFSNISFCHPLYNLYHNFLFQWVWQHISFPSLNQNTVTITLPSVFVFVLSSLEIQRLKHLEHLHWWFLCPLHQTFPPPQRYVLPCCIRFHLSMYVWLRWSRKTNYCHHAHNGQWRFHHNILNVAVIVYMTKYFNFNVLDSYCVLTMVIDKMW